VKGLSQQHHRRAGLATPRPSSPVVATCEDVEV